MSRKQKRRKSRRMDKRVYPLILLFLVLALVFGKEKSDGQEIREKVQETTDWEAQSGETGKNTAKDTETVLTDGLQVHFIDVGQGDATLILCGEHAMLIDAGENDKGTAIQLYLQKQGVTGLDYLIGTHPDSDHIGGMDVVITKFDCATVMMPDYAKDTATYRDVTDAMEYRRYRNTLPIPGDTYQLGEASFTILAPNGYDYGEVTNNYSIGIRLVYGKTSFVFTGDAQKKAEEDILANGLELKADVLKVGHHGSNTSSTEEFVRAVSPAYAVISCGADNEYGFPHEETLDTLNKYGAVLFRTDLLGTIVASSDGENITWESENKTGRLP